MSIKRGKNEITKISGPLPGTSPFDDGEIETALDIYTNYMSQNDTNKVLLDSNLNVARDKYGNDAVKTYLEGFESSAQETPDATTAAVAALATNGISADSDVGAAVVTADESIKYRRQLEEHNSKLVGDGAWDWMQDKLKAGLKLGIAGLQASYQIVNNQVEVVMGNGWAGLSPEGFVESVYGTDLGKMVSGIGNEDAKFNDFGDGWFIDPDSPAARYGVLQGQMRLGGDDWADIYERDENGKILTEKYTREDGTTYDKKVLKAEVQTRRVLETNAYGQQIVRNEIVNMAPSTKGQWIAANWAGEEVGSDAYHNLSGFVDFTSAFLDPSFYVGAGAVRQTARSLGNLGLKAAGKEAKYATKADLEEIRSAGKTVEDIIGKKGGDSAYITQSGEDLVEVLADVQRMTTETLDESGNIIARGVDNVLSDDSKNILFVLSKDLERISKLDSAALKSQSSAERAAAKLEGARAALAKQIENESAALRTGKITDEAAEQLTRKQEILFRITDEADELSVNAALGKNIFEMSQKAHEGLETVAALRILGRRDLKNGERLVQLARARPIGEIGDKVQKVNDVMESFYGVLSREKSVNVDRGLAMMMKSSNRHANETISLLTKITDEALIVDATRGKLNGYMARRLADATDSQQVKNILAEGIAAGQFGRNMGKMRGLRSSAQRRFKGNPDNLAPWYLKSIPAQSGYEALAPAINRATVYANKAYTSRVPWSQPMSTDNLGGLVNLVGDSAHHFLKGNRPGHSEKKAGGKAAVVDEAGDIVEQTGQQFRREWMRRMMRTDTAEERQKVWKEFTDAMIDRQVLTWDIDPADAQRLRESFRKSWDDATSAKKLGAEMRASLDGKGVMFLADGTQINVADQVALEAHLNSKIIAPDWSRLRKTLASQRTYNDEIARLKGNKTSRRGRIDGDQKLQKGSDAIFNRYWRGSVLALRTAYVVRNLGDIQFRMFLKGHPSLFTALPGVVAMAASKAVAGRGGKKIDDVNEKIRDRIFNQPVGNTRRINGEEYWDINADLDDAYHMLGYDTVTFGPGVGSRIDPLAGGDPGIVGSQAGGVPFWRKQMEDAGFEDVVIRSDDDGEVIFEIGGVQVSTTGKDGAFSKYLDGLVHELLMANNSPMAMDFLDFQKSRGIWENKPQDVEEFLTYMMRTESYKAMLDGNPSFQQLVLNRSAQSAAGQNLSSTARAALLKDQLSQREALKEFFFGDGPESYASWFQRHTVDNDTAFDDLLTVNRPAPGASKKEVRRWRRQVKETLRRKLTEGDGAYFRKDPKLGEWKATDNLKLILADEDRVGSPISLGSHFSRGTREVERSKTRQTGDTFDFIVNKFFEWSGKFERQLGYLPEWQFSYWDEAADSIGALSKEEAAIVLERAKRELGGFRAPNSWASTTLRRMKKNAKGAKDESAFSIDDLDAVAGQYASDEVGRLFYNAMNRNQLAHAVRYIAPFVQPFMNTIKIWGAEAGRNFNQISRLETLYEGVQGEGTGSITRLQPWSALQMSEEDGTNPDDSLIYRDQTTGEMMVAVPGLNWAAGLMTNIISGASNLFAGGGQRIGMNEVGGAIPMQNMNIAFQSGLMPGFGPAVTMPASLLSNFYETAPLPNFMLEQLAGNKKWDAGEDGGVNAFLAQLPSWAQKVAAGTVLRGAFNTDAKIRKFYKPLSANLLAQNYERYGSFDERGNPVPLDEEGLRRLNEDVENMAQNLILMEGLMQSVAPGSPNFNIQVPNMLEGDDAGTPERIKYASWQMVSADYMQTVRKTGDRDRAMRDMLQRYGADAVFQLMPARGGVSEYRASNDAMQLVQRNPGLIDNYGSDLSLFVPYGGYNGTLARISANKTGYESATLEERTLAANDIVKEALLAKAIIDRNDGTITHEEYLIAEREAKELNRETPSSDINPTYSEVRLDRVWKAANDPVLVEAAPEVTNMTRWWMTERAKLKRQGDYASDLSGDSYGRARRALIVKGESMANEVPQWRALWETIFLRELLQPEDVK